MVELIGRPRKLCPQTLPGVGDIAHRIGTLASAYEWVCQPFRLIFQQGKQQARRYGIAFGDQLNNVGARALNALDVPHI